MVEFDEKTFKQSSEMARKHYSDIGFRKYSKYLVYILSTVIQAVYSFKLLQNYLLLKMLLPNLFELSKVLKVLGIISRTTSVSQSLIA